MLAEANPPHYLNRARASRVAACQAAWLALAHTSLALATLRSEPMHALLLLAANCSGLPCRPIGGR